MVASTTARQHERQTLNTLNTKRCLKAAKVFNDFENKVFGQDFRCPFRKVQHWVKSGDLFYAAIVLDGRLSPEHVLSVASILVVDAESYEDLVAGRIVENQMVPYSLSRPGAKPMFYYSSLVLAQPSHLIPLFQVLTRDIVDYRRNKILAIDSAFSIPLGNAATVHLAKSGFKTNGQRYLGKYDVMQLERSAAKVIFWKKLLTRRLNPSSE